MKLKVTESEINKGVIKVEMTPTMENYIFIVDMLINIMKHDPFLDNPLHKDLWDTAKEYRDKHFPELKVFVYESEL